MFLIIFAFAATHNIRGCKYLLVEPKITEESCSAEYEIAMNKWRMLSTIKSIWYLTDAKHTLQTNARKQTGLIDPFSGFVEEQNKRISCINNYLSSVRIEGVSETGLLPVRTLFSQCLKRLPIGFDFFSFVQNLRDSDADRIRDVIRYSCYAIHQKLLMELIYDRMHKLLRQKTNLLSIWHKLIKQLYLDTLYTRKQFTQKVLQVKRFTAIEVNAPIKCIESRHFTKDTIEFIDKKAKTEDNVKGLSIVYDISPLLILHFLKYSNKEPYKGGTAPFSQEMLFNVMSYLIIDKTYIALMKPTPVPKIRYLTFIGFPSDLREIADILTVAKTNVKDYQACLKAGLAFLHIICLFKKHFYVSCFAKVPTEGRISFILPVKMKSKFWTSEIDIQYTLMEVKIVLCTDLTLELICGGEQPFTEYASMHGKHFKYYDVFDGPIDRKKIKLLYTHIAGIKSEYMQEEEPVTFDFSQSIDAQHTYCRNSMVSEEAEIQTLQSFVARNKELFMRTNCERHPNPRQGDQRSALEHIPEQVHEQTEEGKKKKAEKQTSVQNSQRQIQAQASEKSENEARKDEAQVKASNANGEEGKVESKQPIKGDKSLMHVEEKKEYSAVKAQTGEINTINEAFDPVQAEKSDVRLESEGQTNVQGKPSNTKNKARQTPDVKCIDNISVLEAYDKKIEAKNAEAKKEEDRIKDVKPFIDCLIVNKIHEIEYELPKEPEMTKEDKDKAINLGVLEFLRSQQKTLQEESRRTALDNKLLDAYEEEIKKICEPCGLPSDKDTKRLAVDLQDEASDLYS